MNSSPGIHLLIGPPNAGKLGRVLTWRRRLEALDPVVVSPTRSDARRLARELVQREGAAVGKPPAMTFDDLAGDILDEAPRRVGTFSREVVIRGLLAELSEGPLAPVAGMPGTASALGALLDDLDEAGFSRSEIVDFLHSWRETSADEVVRTVCDLVEAYENRLGRLGHSRRGEFTARAARVATGWSRPVACYGFTSFTPAQRALLLALAESNPVLLSLQGAGDGGTDELFAEERSWWRTRSASVETLPMQKRVFSSPQLDFFNRAWLGIGGPSSPSAGHDDPPGEPAPRSFGDVASAPEPAGPTGVRFLSAAGRRNEIELVAREIVGLLGQGAAPDDVLVAAPDVGPYRLLVAQVFRRYGIPHRVDGRVRLDQTGLGHALMSGLRGAAAGDRASLISYLRSPYAPVTAEEVDRLEVDLTRAGLRRGRPMALAAARRLPEAMNPLVAVIRGASAPSERAAEESLVSLARRCLTVGAAGAGDEQRLAEDAAVVVALERAIAELETGYDDDGPGVTPPRLDIVLRALSGLAVTVPGEEQQGVVHVAPLRRVRARRCTTLFILGLVEGEFPAAPAAPEVLSPLQRRSANEAAGRRLFPERPRSEDDDLFALAVSRPWQLLYLSTRDSEEDGREALPSPFFSRALEILGMPPLHASRGLDEITHPVHAGPSEREYLRACAADGLTPSRRDLARALEGLPRWRSAPRFVTEGLRVEFERRSVFSANELETHASCPFRWYIQQVVRLEDLEEEVDARAVGTVAHEVLKNVYRGLKTEGLLPLRDEGLSRAGELLTGHLTRSLARFDGAAEPGEMRMLEAQIRGHLEGLLAFDASSGTSLTPWRLEYDFGGKAGIDVGGLRIRGRVDRVDAGPEGDPVLVIDYKGGRTVPKPRFSQEGALQVPLYLMALRAERPGISFAGGLYASLAGDTRSGLVVDDFATDLGGWAEKVVTADELELELDAVLADARETAEQIRRGRIDAEPPDGCPRFCDLAAVCRSGRRPEEF